MTHPANSSRLENASVEVRSGADHIFRYRVCLSLTWSPHDLEDLVQLINLRVSGKQGLMVKHLGKDAPNRPDVHRGGVRLGSKQNLRRPVPQRDHLIQHEGAQRVASEFGFVG